MARATRAQLRALAAGVGLAACLAIAAPVSATHRGEGVVDEVQLQLTLQAARVPGVSDQLVAHLFVDNGSPVVGVEVEFLREVEFLGERMIPLGVATTDAAGSAQLAIRSRNRSFEVQARFNGNDSYLPAVLSMPITLSAAPDEVEQPLLPEADLNVVSAVMPPTLAATALAVWVLLIGLCAITVRAIRRRRPVETLEKEDHT